MSNFHPLEVVGRGIARHNFKWVKIKVKLAEAFRMRSTHPVKENRQEYKGSSIFLEALT